MQGKFTMNDVDVSSMKIGMEIGAPIPETKYEAVTKNFVCAIVIGVERCFFFSDAATCRVSKDFQAIFFC